MKIILTPQRRDDTLVVVKSGETLNINGEDFELSPIGEGDTLPASAIASEWFVGEVNRVNGEIELNIILPNPWNYSQEQAFPTPLVNVPDGPVVFPGPLPAPLPPEPAVETSTIPTQQIVITKKSTGERFAVDATKLEDAEPES